MALVKFVGLVAGACLAHAAHAVSLPDVGSFAFLPGTTAAAEPQLAGTVVADITTSFNYLRQVVIYANPPVPPEPVVGTVQSRVVRSSADGSYDFYWRVTVDENELTRLRLDNFITAAYRANWRSDGLGTAAPVYAQRSSGDSVTFGFNDIVPGVGEFGGLAAGQSSYFFFLDTDAHAYNEAASFVLDSSRSQMGSGSVSGSSAAFATFAPAIPEPQAWALMLAGLLSLPLLSRRRDAARRRSGGTGTS